MRRMVPDSPKERAQEKAKQDEQRKIVIPQDVVHEVAVLASAVLDKEALGMARRRVRPDHFGNADHASAWEAILECARQNLDVDVNAVRAVGGERVAATVAGALEVLPTPAANLAWHVEGLLWDAARVRAAKGPVTAFLEALRDNRVEPERVRSLSRQVSASFDGWQDRRHLRDEQTLVRETMMAVEERVNGQACFSYGVPDLDRYRHDVDDNDRWRMVPGTFPGGMTVLTAVSGGGKSTVTANIALGLAGFDFQTGEFGEAYRRVLWGAWEMTSPMNLELMAGISLDWSRSEMTEGIGPSSTYEGRVMLEERMHLIAKRVRFIDNPFRQKRGGERPSVDRNLDMVEGYIADTACDIFVADLWERALPEDAGPGVALYALTQAQAMLQESRVHGIFLHQTNLKDLEDRADKRPSRTVAKGSAGYIEVPDAVIGIHYPALFKNVSPRTLEFLILKQRKGRWPLAIEFEWDPDKGRIYRGKSMPYDQPGDLNEIDNVANLPKGKGRGPGKPRGARP